MASGSTDALTDPRGLPETLYHVTGIYVLSAVGNLIWVPLAISPVLIVFLVAGNYPPGILLSGLFGIFASTSLGSISTVREGLYKSENESFQEAFDEDPAKVVAFFQKIALAVLVVVAYLCLLYAIAVSLASALPGAALFVAVGVPLGDRLLLTTFDRSPVSTAIEGFAQLAEFFGIVEQINLGFLRHGNLMLALKDPQVRA